MADVNRGNRPLSPHLQIYRPMLTMMMSIVHRITGAGLYFGMLLLAWWLIAAGVTRLVVAGGETSGAVVGALGVTMLEIGPEIDPGVPWTASVGAKPMLLALKSGNFGTEDFFTKAFAALP